jgi:hypothetical protein
LTSQEGKQKQEIIIQREEDKEDVEEEPLKDNNRHQNVVPRNGCQILLN